MSESRPDATDATLTFAIPFHRGLPYLEIAIESVLAQDRADWRLIVCDDGRLEAGAAELLASLADPRIAYAYNEENLGMAANWNRCLDEAETPLVTLLHADDRLRPGYAGLVLELAERHPEAVAYFCGAQIIDETGRPRFSTADAVKRIFVPPDTQPDSGEIVLRSEPGVRALMAGNFIMCPTLCFRRDRLGDRRFDEQWRQVQDLELTVRLLIEGESIAGCRTTAYEYRRHDAGATARQSESFLRFDEEYALFDEVARRCEALGWHDAARVSRSKRIVKLHLAYRALGEVLGLRPGRALETVRYLTRGRPGLGGAQDRSIDGD